MGFWPVVKKVVKDSDVVLEILDARMPKLSRNRELERICRRNNTEFIVVLNKIDLVGQERLGELRKEYGKGFFVSGSKNINIGRLRTALQIRAKKLKRDLKVGVAGYPNVGKSAIINTLARRARAAVSLRAGTTRGIQWVKVSNLLILDSPGVVPFGDNEVKLGILGAKNPEKLKNVHKVTYALIRELGREVIGKNYNVKIEGKDEGEIIEEIGKKKGFLRKGGLIDEQRTLYSIIRDWQKGKLRV
jgi:ribosome biogenesis GTPase A